MNRRQFLQTLALVPLASYIKDSTATKAEITQVQKIKIETVPVAGFQYYQGENLWSQLKIDDSLKLLREPNNKYDDNAIIIKWQGQQLGYIPRVDNSNIAKLMDNGQTLSAEIIALSNSSNPWKRVEVAVFQMLSS